MLEARSGTAGGPRGCALDEAMTAAADRYGLNAVRIVVHRGFVDGDPFRPATTDSDMRNVDGVRIGTIADWVLKKLNSREDN